jgi:hypothetical protein
MNLVSASVHPETTDSFVQNGMAMEAREEQNADIF